MPFPTSNPKPLSTVTSRNILKENVPKSFPTTHLTSKKSNTSLTKKTTLSTSQEKPTTRLSNLPKLNSKVSEKENTIVVERTSNVPSTHTTRLPLKSIKKPGSIKNTAPATTRISSHPRVFSQVGSALKPTTTTTVPSNSNLSKKSSTSVLDSHSSSTTGNVVSKDALLPTSTSSVSSLSSLSSISSSTSSTLTVLPISTTKVPKSIPKKRVINEENIAPSDSLSVIPSSPLDEDKENRVYASASKKSTTTSTTTTTSILTSSTKYPTSKNSSESLGDELDEFSVRLDSATSTARSKKLKIMDSDLSSTSGRLSKINYKSIHLHEEVIEEQNEQEWMDKENRENEGQRREEGLRVLSQPTKPTGSSQGFMFQSSTEVIKQKETEVVQETKRDLIVAPPTLSLSEKMKKFGIPEIDVEDVEDVTLCAEYVQEILEYLMRREKVFMPTPNYIDLHPELQWHMRVILVDWLMEVSQKFKFLPETIFLGVNIMDRFLSKRTVSLNKYQLVGLASLFIAAKIEEIYCPPVTNFTFMTDSAFNDDEMLRAEQYILKTLAFEIWAPGPFSFIRRISKVDDYNADHRSAAKFLAEASLLTHQALCFPPSLLAASTMYLARWIYKAPGSRWSPAFQTISGYLETDLLDCIRTLLRFLLSPSDPESFFFKKKYAGRKFAYILHELRRLADEFHSPSSSSSS